MIADVARLRTLRKVAEHGSFSRAATELGYTQSAVSQQIAALEDEVGLSLLNRAVRPVELTDAGRTLNEHATRVLEHLAAAEAELDAVRGLRTGRLRLTAFPSAFSTFLPTAIAKFRRRHPDVTIELTEAEPDTATALLRTGEADLAIVYDPPDGLEVIPLLEDEHRALLPARHPLAARRELTVAALAGEAWIVPRSTGPARGYRARLDALCAEAGFAPRIALETDDLQAVQAFVAAGLGVALAHDLTMPLRRHNVAVRPLSGPRLTRQVAAVAMPGRRTPPAAALLKILTD